MNDMLETVTFGDKPSISELAQTIYIRSVSPNIPLKQYIFFFFFLLYLVRIFFILFV
jgi:hypothetical protein